MHDLKTTNNATIIDHMPIYSTARKEHRTHINKDTHQTARIQMRKVKQLPPSSSMSSLSIDRGHTELQHTNTSTLTKEATTKIIRQKLNHL